MVFTVGEQHQHVVLVRVLAEKCQRAVDGRSQLGAGGRQGAGQNGIEHEFDDRSVGRERHHHHPVAFGLHQGHAVAGQGLDHAAHQRLTDEEAIRRQVGGGHRQRGVEHEDHIDAVPFDLLLAEAPARLGQGEAAKKGGEGEREHRGPEPRRLVAGEKAGPLAAGGKSGGGAQAAPVDEAAEQGEHRQ